MDSDRKSTGEKRTQSHELAGHSNKRSRDYEASADALAWHPEWITTGQEHSERPAKHQRLLRMSELYQSMRDAVFVALEARELKDQEERAKSLDIALRHPLQCEEQVGQELGHMSSSPASPDPAPRSPTLEDTASAKATPALSPQKGLRLLPTLKLDSESKSTVRVMQ
jgi:hypothetical protein